jgi:P27 family predicted phage terminase small subunit
VKGRKPTPTALKLLKGNPGKRPINRNEPKPSPRAPGCPTWLAPEARAEWRRVVPALDKIGMLAKVDRAALTAYCETWATFVTAQRDLHEHGLVLHIYEDLAVTDDGKTIKVQVRATKNPSVMVARDAAAQIRAFCAEFGLTPSARSRMELPETGDELDSMFS